MNVSNFLDANVWLALLWNRHIHSEKVHDWFQSARDEQFFYCRFTQITVLRLLTTEAVMGEDVRTMSQTWHLWQQASADPHIAFLPEPEALSEEFRARSSLSSKSPKVWADAYLLAFTVVSGVKLVTLDNALRSRGVDVLVL